MTVARSQWHNIRLYSWLFGASICLIAALILWMMTDEQQLVTEVEPVEEKQTQVQPEKVAATQGLGSLLTQVRPLEMNKRVVITGAHDAEFRGTKFIQDNKKNWSIELFRANKEEVIQNYILDNPQRQNLIYFRLSGEQHAEQYVLAYGVYNSFEAAKAALAQLPLSLPASVKPQTVSFEQYLGLVNDMGSEELSNQNAYHVNLKPAAVPVIDETVLAQIKASMNATAKAREQSTVSTTVTRKDQQGNVVDVQRQSSGRAPEKAPEKPKESPAARETPQISDPFN